MKKIKNNREADEITVDKNNSDVLWVNTMFNTFYGVLRTKIVLV